MNSFVLGYIWSNSYPFDMDAWFRQAWTEKFDWLMEHVSRNWEYDIALDYMEFSGQGNYRISIVFDYDDDALLYKLRWE